MDLKENTNQVFQQVTKAIQETGREDGSVSVIAVTKYVDIAIVRLNVFCRSIFLERKASTVFQKKNY